ncbi:helix-turn-helix transcriptional regulator [Myxococcota bacterium]
MRRFLSYRQASEVTGIRLATLYSLVHRKEIPHARISKRMVLFPEAELLAWIEERIVTPGNHFTSQGLADAAS